MWQRINSFGVLLGGVPSINEDADNTEQSFVDAVLIRARGTLELLATAASANSGYYLSRRRRGTRGRPAEEPIRGGRGRRAAGSN